MGKKRCLNSFDLKNGCERIIAKAYTPVSEMDRRRLAQRWKHSCWLIFLCYFVPFPIHFLNIFRKCWCYRIVCSIPFFWLNFFLLFVVVPQWNESFFLFSSLAFFFVVFLFRFISFSVVIFRTSIYWTELNIMMHTASVSLFQKKKNGLRTKSRIEWNSNVTLHAHKKKSGITVVVKWAKRVKQMYLKCRKKVKW